MTSTTTANPLSQQGANNPFNPLPAVGDIVWCAFPEIERPGVPGPKARPALVIAVAPAKHVVRICYGTTQRTDKLYPGEFVIEKSDARFALSGLSYTTKFNVTRTVNVPFDDAWFKAAPGLTPMVPLPKLGTLHPSYCTAASEAAKKRPRTT
ncbi:type II toxin-antitoxin system PemK/MazF family toxin [Pseudomonas sp. Marseille-P8916]|uniref:type II toxin-antitoxin system PemK/MazF family toxin n=1 Tax=Pseudomonas sp. Marseille-P8916 TaxID=2866589 RepID=UPI001CE441E1|nr:type II toxin-antitoxin system PemK/MazF family toxin [Pseudomonas sp. Marseille-P8916]